MVRGRLFGVPDSPCAPDHKAELLVVFSVAQKLRIVYNCSRSFVDYISVQTLARY